MIKIRGDKDPIAESVIDIAKECVRLGVKDVLFLVQRLILDAVLLSSVQLVTFFKINVQHISFILLITRT